jgi:hypothetical protein
LLRVRYSWPIRRKRNRCTCRYPNEQNKVHPGIHHRNALQSIALWRLRIAGPGEDRQRRHRRHRRQRKQEPSDLPNRPSPGAVGRQALPPRFSVIHMFVVGDASGAGVVGAPFYSESDTVYAPAD